MFNNSKIAANSRQNRRKRQGTSLKSKWVERIAIQSVISCFLLLLLLCCTSAVAQTITHVPLFTVDGDSQFDKTAPSVAALDLRTTTCFYPRNSVPQICFTKISWIR